MSTNDLKWLLFNTVPVPGERAAARESWANVLMNAGLGRTDVILLLEEASRRWSYYDVGVARS
jgi:hypothetical protein